MTRAIDPARVRADAPKIKMLTDAELQALGQAARAYNACVKSRDPKMEELARCVFRCVWDRVWRGRP